MNYFKNIKTYLITIILALIVTIVLLGDNLITLIKYNEYGGWGVGLFAIIFLAICLTAFAFFLLIGFVVYLIVYKTKKKIR